MMRAKTTPRAVADALLAYVPPPPPRTRPGPVTIAKWNGFPKEDARFLEKHPHAFLFGVIFDRMVSANKAWLAPRQLALRLGHLDIPRLAEMPVDDLAVVIKGRRTEPALHRFTNTMARAIVSASKKVLDEYAGDARNIWAGDPGARAVITRLDAFEGISHKLAHMATRLLVHYYGVVLSGWESIDIAVDRHVARVFLRTGLIRGTPGQTEYTAAEVKSDALNAARNLSPSFPGALDEPAFFVGSGWCTADRAWCADGQSPCPLLPACARNRTDWAIR